jgi:hypothetical protein
VNRGTYLAVVPWLAMVLAVRRDGLGFELSAELAAAGAIGVAAWARARWRPVGFELASAGLFTLFALGAHLVPAPAQPELAELGRAVTAGALALVLAVSVTLRPFTVQYTQDLVPPDLVPTERFTRINVLATLTCAVTTLAMALSFLVATTLHDSVGPTAFNWFVPLALAICCARSLGGRGIDLHEWAESARPLRSSLDLFEMEATVARRPTDRSGRPRLRALTGGDRGPDPGP